MPEILEHRLLQIHELVFQVHRSLASNLIPLQVLRRVLAFLLSLQSLLRLELQCQVGQNINRSFEKSTGFRRDL